MGQKRRTARARSRLPGRRVAVNANPLYLTEAERALLHAELGAWARLAYAQPDSAFYRERRAEVRAQLATALQIKAELAVLAAEGLKPHEARTKLWRAWPESWRRAWGLSAADLRRACSPGGALW